MLKHNDRYREVSLKNHMQRIRLYEEVPRSMRTEIYSYTDTLEDIMYIVTTKVIRTSLHQK